MSRLHQALDALTSVLVDLGSPVPAQLRPGLSLEQIARLTEPLPYQLPPELVSLYQWRDGTHVDEGDHVSNFVPAGEFVTLAEAVQVYENRLIIIDEIAAPDLPAERLWDRSAFPVFTMEFGWKAMWVALCGTRGPETQCGFWDPEDGSLQSIYPSHTALIEDTAAALAAGHIRYEPGLGVTGVSRSPYNDNTITPWPGTP